MFDSCIHTVLQDVLKRKNIIEELKKEVEALKAALRHEKGTPQQQPSGPPGPSGIMSPTMAGLGGYL